MTLSWWHPLRFAMPANFQTQLQELRHSFDLLQERVNELERESCRLNRQLLKLNARMGRVPFNLPTRKRTKAAALLSSALAVAALFMAFTPQNIKVGEWEYHSDGVTPEATASVGAMIGVWITLRNHLRDKEEFLKKTGADDDQQS
jgi:hypothetical protein